MLARVAVRPFLSRSMSSGVSHSSPVAVAYQKFLPSSFLSRLNVDAEPVHGVEGLRANPALKDFGEIESPSVLSLVVEVFREVEAELGTVLQRRAEDRDFMDACVLQHGEAIGHYDAAKRLVIGPLAQPTSDSGADPPVEVPEFMRGTQVTLFGPPESAKMSINAMNALHRKLPGEAPIIGELVELSGVVPRWGADSEDSKTPISSDLRRASLNLNACFDGTIADSEPVGSKYQLAKGGLSLPIKRVPGLALPDGDHLLNGEPLPLHLVELVQHIWLNRTRPEARVVYFPKLENEEEAAYLASLIGATERAVQRRMDSYPLGTVKVICVFENPRAIFRIREMANALHPYFIGGSLGWHDFLASAARVYRHDPGYQIPVKADPNIVINAIKESHLILVRALAPLGAMKIGGMYGVLHTTGDDKSFSVAMAGYIRDVVTQLKRGLDGFWVAHPDFVRIGIALTEAWKYRDTLDPEQCKLQQLVSVLVVDATERAKLVEFIAGEDVPGLPQDDPRYCRAVLAATHGASSIIANNDPAEVRYNIFQALQYLADWLSGNGCVALPATLKNAAGEEVVVRVMDDLATTERSRWEVWAEVRHGRLSIETFDELLADEVAFLQAGHTVGTKQIQVRWEGEAAAWYPHAVKLLRQLMTDPEPVEFVTELIMPFTFEQVRNAEDPWKAAVELCPGKYKEA